MVGREKRSRPSENDVKDEEYLRSLVCGAVKQQRENNDPKHETMLEQTDLKPAWSDDDDGNEEISVDISSVNRLRKLRETEDETVISGKEYSKRLRSRFQKTSESTRWADLSRKDENIDSEDDELFRGTETLLGESLNRLPKGILRVSRVKDANQHSPSNAVVRSVQFHPSGQVLLTAGFDKTIGLFQIDGKQNKRIQGVYLPDLPIDSACFSPDGKRIYAAGYRPYYYTYDLETGAILKVTRVMARKQTSLQSVLTSPDGNIVTFLSSNGFITLASSRSNQWIGNLKMNGSCKAAAFSKDGNSLFTTGSEGEVYKWDMRVRRCLYRHVDEGSLGGTAIATSCTEYYAVGSTSGVVNLYRDQDGERAKPIKSFMHLTTSVSSLKFNHDSQILAMASKIKRDTLKLVHVSSQTVFSNWPTAKTPLHYVSALDISPSSGYLAVANDTGKVLLYRLNHFSSL